MNLIKWFGLAGLFVSMTVAATRYQLPLSQPSRQLNLSPVEVQTQQASNRPSQGLAGPIQQTSAIIIDHEKVAQQQLAQINQGITDLVSQFPTTSAAREVIQVLEQANLKVVPEYGIYPKDTIVISGFPIIR